LISPKARNVLDWRLFTVIEKNKETCYRLEVIEDETVLHKSPSYENTAKIVVIAYVS